MIFTLGPRRGTLDCAAYEPSKGFRDVVRALRPGDRSESSASCGRSPGP